MNNRFRLRPLLTRAAALLLCLALAFSFAGCAELHEILDLAEDILLSEELQPDAGMPEPSAVPDTPAPQPDTPAPGPDENAVCTSKEDVAAYLEKFGRLPDNFITKNEARRLGWDSKAGNLDEVAPGKSIGGDHFGNFEGRLPEKNGRQYYECDIDYQGGHRGAKRIVFSNDGLIYYTEDHYNTFTLLYGEE